MIWLAAVFAAYVLLVAAATAASLVHGTSNRSPVMIGRKK